MTAAPNPAASSAATAEIRAVLARYCQLCDDGRFDEWAELFTADASFVVLGKVHQGRDAVKGFITAAQPPEARGKHLISEPMIEVDGARARAWTDYAFIAKASGGLAVTSAGRYHDRLSFEDGRWRLARREIVFLGDVGQDEPAPG